MTDMTALRAHHRGGPEVLTVEQAPVPVPAPGEVLVAVHAAAITFDELTWQETWMRDGADRTPTIPSHEVSGVVAATDSVTVPAADLAARPSTVSHTESAALPLAGLTAWQALVEHAHVQGGESVFVLGGAGGVGALTVELACSLGAEVTTTVRSDAARDLVTKLGAVHVIDTRTIEFDGAAASYDVAVDTIGGQTLERTFAVLRPGGRLVTLSGPPPEGMAEAYDVASTFFIVTPDRSQLARLAELVDAGRLRVAIAATFPLRDGRAAFESGRLPHRRPGKTVLIVRD
jgi:NADPH:quinone reductase-like Zn-dependent oxidoreductase